MGDDRFDVVGHRTETNHHHLRVVAHEGMDRRIRATGQRRVFIHGLTHEARHFADEVRAVVGRAGLEVRLVLHRAGEARIVDVDLCRHQLARALFERIEPLPPPLTVQLLRQPGERLGDQFAFVVLLDLFAVGGEEFLQRGEVGRRDVAIAPHQVLRQLKYAPLGTKQNFLCQSRRLDTSGRVAEVFAQQLGFGHARLAHHVAGGKTVHRIGDRDQRERRDAVGNRRQVGRFLRVRAEEDGVAGGKQRVDVVVSGHHVERVLGDDACGHLQHEAADLLADRHIVRFERVQDALARRGVRDELAAGQRRAERAALRRMLALGLEEERVLAPDIDAAFGAERFIDLGDLGRWRDRVADDAAADVAHDVRHRAVAVDDAGDAGIFHF